MRVDSVFVARCIVSTNVRVGSHPRAPGRPVATPCLMPPYLVAGRGIVT